MQKLAIIGASILQRPLVEKAKNMKIETHVFAWTEGCAIIDIADYFYPISVTNKEEILKYCRDIGIDGVVSIASDISMPTVNFVAHGLKLVGNSIETSEVTTNKYLMRQLLIKAGIPCPKFKEYSIPNFDKHDNLKFPIIVKPIDSSGSRGVTKIEKFKEVNTAIRKALAYSFKKKVIIEEFIEGKEFSVEMISWNGEHYFLNITDKVTTGAPYFVEIEHHQPANISDLLKDKIIRTIKKSLDALNFQNGASHSEIIVSKSNKLTIVEIGGRMGGDFIGSNLVELSTGYDYVKGVIEISLGTFKKPKIRSKAFCGVYFLCKETEYLMEIFKKFVNTPYIVKAEIYDNQIREVQNSSDRSGFIIYNSDKKIIFNNI